MSLRDDMVQVLSCIAEGWRDHSALRRLSAAFASLRAFAACSCLPWILCRIDDYAFRDHITDNPDKDQKIVEKQQKQ